MIAQATLQSRTDEYLRPFDVRRDLLQLAELIELAFQEELEQSGNSIAREMREMAQSGPLLWLFAANPKLTMQMSGYVWVADGRIVGNVSLGLESGQPRLWTISNVAVHPGFRGRGIAQRLMQAAVEELHSRGARCAVLEVRSNNTPAQSLYRALGFELYDNVEELRLPVHAWADNMHPPTLPLRRRRPNDWQDLYDLCKAAVPVSVQEVMPLLPYHFQVGLERRLHAWLERTVAGRGGADLVLEDGGEIVAWLQATGQVTAGSYRLDVTVHPRRRGALEPELVTAGLQQLSHLAPRSVASTISASHPEALQAWHGAGFYTVRKLDRMALYPQREGWQTP